ncbi:DUF551 domain-containing protein [Klebsiella pneumoniae]|uniref:DUF551 domain-containing protein n=1 Tax=Klebsiella pneumoniae TaxID=573 RepID=UPI0024B162A0|nr:DUF551 domain-containing protein [Klebsiella pneumoniae]MDI9031391.1 DUF551 domain-containing protein [Klebsiella pneumoniae]HEN5215104.1 DUF551 domain-containing protein [Klebsiella pneumoniae]
MSIITKESIADTIQGLENLANSGIQSVYIDMAIAGMRRLLASLEAEPVAWLLSGGGAKNNVSFDSGNAYADPLREVTPLYTAPPAPVSVPDNRAITQHFDTIALETAREIMCDVNRRHEFLGGEVQLLSRIQCRIDDAFRAAMLQGAEPVNQNDELPLDYLQGHKDGLEWSAQLAEANHPQTGDWLYDDPIELARAIRKGPDMPTAQDGNSPVTPDGWIPVSERMPNDKDFVWCWGYVSGWTESDGFEAYYDATRNKWWTIDDETVRKVTHWMPLPAAPLWE